MPVRRTILVLGLVGVMVFTFYTFNLPRKKTSVRTTSYSPGTTNVTLAINPELDSFTAAELYIKEIRIEANEIFIQFADNLPSEAFSLPVYLNKNFKDKWLLIPKDADLSKYKFDGPDELSGPTFSNHALAFIAAFPREVNKKELDYNYKFLYLDRMEKDHTAIFKMQDVYKIKNNTNVRHGIPKSFRVTNIFTKDTLGLPR